MRLLKALMVLNIQRRFAGAGHEMRITTGIYDLVESILKSEQYAPFVDVADIDLLIDIYERASRLGGGYGTRFTTEEGVKDLYAFAQRATPEVRERIVTWALRGEKGSALRNEFIKKDIQEYAKTGSSFLGKGSASDYLDMLLSSNYIVKEYYKAFEQFLDTVAKDAEHVALASYHKRILSKFREAKINDDAGIFRTMWLRKARRDQSIFDNDVFEESLLQAVNPEIRSIIQNARRDIKPLLYVFALGGMLSDRALRDFVFGAQKVREREGSMLSDPAIISMIMAAEPTYELMDPDDMSERFNALDSDVKRKIFDKWNEINPEHRIDNVQDAEFDMLVTFFETMRQQVADRLAKEKDSKQEADKRFGNYTLPIYLHNLFIKIGYTVRLDERDVGYSDSAWRAFTGDVSTKPVSEDMDKAKFASKQRPRRAVRVVSEKVSVNEFHDIFIFLNKLPSSYKEAVDSVINGLPPSVFRNFVLYMLFVDRILIGEMNFNTTVEGKYDLALIQSHISALGMHDRTVVMERLSRIIPYLVHDKAMETANQATLADYLRERKFGKEELDRRAIRQGHRSESEAYEDFAFTNPGGALAQLQIFVRKVNRQRYRANCC